ncbi:MAG TPA: c-type cytochrome [Chitinophagaceae bacterium]|nr:c-type cytochrome [Chitinophagaceae bacterium]
MKRVIFFLPMGMMVLIAFNMSKNIDKTIMDRGKKVYTQYCMACHQFDGSGVPGLNPPLEKTAHVLGSKTKLIRIILKGMDTHEEIDGETYSNVMAPHNQLTDQQIADVLTYIRNSFGNQAVTVTPGDVKYVRARTK